ncbi:MAG: DUF4493 domain-containing protein [Candidatus Cryptobacteroides sp.]
MKKTAIAISALILAACNMDVIESQQMGTITLSVSQTVEVTAETKAVGSVDCSGFLVGIAGQTFLGNEYSWSGTYGSIEGEMEIPYGSYSVSAESCSETVAQTGFGCVRYFGESGQIDILSPEPVPVSVTCNMANGKATITFDSSFLEDFEDVSSKMSVDERDVALTGEQSDGNTEVYFNVSSSGSHLIYTIYGTVGKGTANERKLSYSNSASPLLLSPAKWAKITIRSNHNGLIGPGIDADEDFDENSSSEILDPSEGELTTDDMMGLPSILVDTTLDDVTEIDCEIDVLSL